MKAPREPETDGEAELLNDGELDQYVEALLNGDDVLLKGVSDWGPTRFSLCSYADGKDKFSYYISSSYEEVPGVKVPREEHLWPIDEAEVREQVRDTLDDERFEVVIKEEEDGAPADGGTA